MERKGTIFIRSHDRAVVDSETNEEVGRIRAEVIEGNVVITVEREDESKFGPVSLVVV